MANTTFNGPVRAKQGFKQITKNATTGAITDNTTIDACSKHTLSLIHI